MDVAAGLADSVCFYAYLKWWLLTLCCICPYLTADAGLLGKPATAAPFIAALATSVDSIIVRQQLPASIHSITSKIHRSSDEGNERLLQEHAAVSKYLQKLGVSLSAMMAILRYCERRPMNLITAQGRIKQLQERFGESVANDMLTLAPGLLTRNTDRLLDYYKALTHVLGSEKLTKVIVKKMPELLQHKPEMVQARIQALQEMLQVSCTSPTDCPVQLWTLGVTVAATVIANSRC